MSRKIIDYKENNSIKYELSDEDMQILIDHPSEYPCECATDYSCECDNIYGRIEGFSEERMAENL